MGKYNVIFLIISSHIIFILRINISSPRGIIHNKMQTISNIIHRHNPIGRITTILTSNIMLCTIIIVITIALIHSHLFIITKQQILQCTMEVIIITHHNTIPIISINNNQSFHSNRMNISPISIRTTIKIQCKSIAHFYFTHITK